MTLAEADALHGKKEYSRRVVFEISALTAISLTVNRMLHVNAALEHPDAFGQVRISEGSTTTGLILASWKRILAPHILKAICNVKWHIEGVKVVEWGCMIGDFPQGQDRMGWIWTCHQLTGKEWVCTM